MTQLFEPEDRANRADKEGALATAALLASMHAQHGDTILQAPTNATIDALVGEGFNAPAPCATKQGAVDPEPEDRWCSCLGQCATASTVQCDASEEATLISAESSALRQLQGPQHACKCKVRIVYTA